MFQTRQPSDGISIDRLAVGSSRVLFEVISIRRKIIWVRLKSHVSHQTSIRLHPLRSANSTEDQANQISESVSIGFGSSKLRKTASVARPCRGPIVEGW